MKETPLFSQVRCFEQNFRETSRHPLETIDYKCNLRTSDYFITYRPAQASENKGLEH